MKKVIRRQPQGGTREREEARAFVQVALGILASLLKSRGRRNR